jgi:tetratricopeptide (TPR) repeat protein
MPTVYLSLWSAGSEPAAQKIADHIKTFVNKDSILNRDVKKGFIPQEIRDNLARCEVLIVVFAEESESNSTIIPEQGMSERTRFEFVTAINLDLMIIPLLIDDAQLPEKEQMPGALQSLLNYKPNNLRSASWFEDMDYLLEEIQEELDFKKDVEKKLSQPVPDNFPIENRADENLVEPTRLGLEFSGALEIKNIIDLETNNLEEARRKKNHNLEQQSLSSLGLCFARLGQTKKAIQYFEEQLEIVRKQDDPNNLCELLANLGDALAVSGNIERARNFYEEQLAIANAMGYLSHVGSSNNGLGFVHVKRDEFLKAIECYLKALDVYQELKDHDKTLELLVGIGLNHQKLGNLEKTSEYLERALDAAKYVENRKEEARLLTDLAEVHIQQGNDEQAKIYFGRAEETLNGLNETWAESLKQHIIHLRKESIREN